jgi:3-oxoacyl-[acyl-carrier protein] reductase
MPTIPPLTGRTALVTGGSRGIGAAIALALAEAGAKVAINYRKEAAQADAVADKITASGGEAAVFAADVSQADEVKGLVQRVATLFGPIDILVNNAGIATTRGLDNLTEADFDETMLVNLKSAFLCTQAVLPSMRAWKWGRIVNISSGAARGAGAIGPHYNASKAGMEGLTRGYASRLVKDGITVNSVAPSLIETDMMGGRTDTGEPTGPREARPDDRLRDAVLRTAMVARIPLGRFGRPDEVAQAVLMVVGNDYMTGQTIALSGGMTFI